jgi:hypothetical protein
LRSIVAISLGQGKCFWNSSTGTSDNRKSRRRASPYFWRWAIRLAWRLKTVIYSTNFRRSEELHVLNEIGRALSSTLNKEDLLRKVWEELRRLFDAENFYIASLESNSDEMTFDLEMIDGARMPKRTRPAGNHIT